MPLRDHFSATIPMRFRWEGFHSQWAGTMVRHLNRGLLPTRYTAVPRIRLGTQIEIDVATLEDESMGRTPEKVEGAVAVYSPPRPALSFEADLSQQDEFEVRVYDDERGESLVAAIELVSPRNKDRPQSRHDFVFKCAQLLKAHVSLILIDIVTDRRTNLFRELMEYLEIRDLVHLQEHLYSCSLLPRGSNGHAKVDVWPETLHVGAVLPKLPLWLREDLAVPLDLETKYEETCGDLRA